MIDKPDNLIERVGVSLFGNPWRNNLCILLDVSPRTLRRWIESPTSVPPRVWREIADAIGKRQEHLGLLIADAWRRGGRES